MLVTLALLFQFVFLHFLLAISNLRLLVGGLGLRLHVLGEKRAGISTRLSHVLENHEVCDFSRFVNFKIGLFIF